MSKRKRTIINQYRNLKDNGWLIEDTSSYLKFNGGSETLRHRTAKTVAAHVALENDYVVASEVVNKHDKEADILAYGHDSRRPIVIELENGLTDETRKKKLNHYNVDPVREVFIVDLDEWMNNDPAWLSGYIKSVTGL